jgi:DNA repair protein RadC
VTALVCSGHGGPAVMVRHGRRYRPASRDELLAALGSVDYGRAAGVKLESPGAASAFIVDRMGRLPCEVFAAVLLDNRHRVIAVRELFRGTIDGAAVHPREVVRECLAAGAAAVVLAHNHPSGVAEPSQADELITMRLREALALVEIRLLDHVIVAGTATISLAQRGLI